MLGGDRGEVCERLEDDIVKIRMIPRERPRVQLFGAAQSLVELLFSVQELLRGSVPAIGI